MPQPRPFLGRIVPLDNCSIASHVRDNHKRRSVLGSISTLPPCPVRYSRFTWHDVCGAECFDRFFGELTGCDGFFRDDISLGRPISGGDLVRSLQESTPRFANPRAYTITAIKISQPSIRPTRLPPLSASVELVRII